MRSTQTVIAICSCHARFYYNERGIDRMNEHINDNNYKVHQWVEVPDIYMVQDCKAYKQE